MQQAGGTKSDRSYRYASPWVVSEVTDPDRGSQDEVPIAFQASRSLSTPSAVSQSLPRPAPKTLHIAPLGTFCSLSFASIARRRVLGADVQVPGGNGDWIREGNRQGYLERRL
jgi:hypothetical protein